jgi:hypothetical protein
LAIGLCLKLDAYCKTGLSQRDVAPIRAAWETVVALDKFPLRQYALPVSDTFGAVSDTLFPATTLLVSDTFGAVPDTLFPATTLLVSDTFGAVPDTLFPAATLLVSDTFRSALPFHAASQLADAASQLADAASQLAKVTQLSPDV